MQARSVKARVRKVHTCERRYKALALEVRLLVVMVHLCHLAYHVTAH